MSSFFNRLLESMVPGPEETVTTSHIDSVQAQFDYDQSRSARAGKSAQPMGAAAQHGQGGAMHPNTSRQLGKQGRGRGGHLSGQGRMSMHGDSFQGRPSK